ncbi:MAG: ornithine carbamoyltransferase [Polyangiaceae bacterium]
MLPRHLLDLSDLGGGDGVRALLAHAACLEGARDAGGQERPLIGRTLALVFDKPSTRTRLAFEVAAVELGAHPMLITPTTSQTGRGEPLEDTARVFGRLVSAVACRTGSHAGLRTLARASSAPVLNALTDDAHPLQTLADLYTVLAERGTLEGLRYVWVGDASNVARSWIEAAGLLGLHLVLACPAGFGPPPAEVELAGARGGRVELTDDARAAARGADVLITDVWVSMGQEAEVAARRKALADYRIDRAMVGGASPEVVVLHCLPAHRGEEIAAEVIDGPRSFVWDAVEARLHVTKAALLWCLHLAPEAPPSLGRRRSPH